MSREMHDSLGHYDRDQRGFAERPEVRGEEARGSLGRGRGSQEPDPGGAIGGRRWVRALKPLALEDRASPEAMAALARSFEGTGLDVRFAVEGSEELSGAAELVLYRALQEGLTNVLKHSSARRVAALLTSGRRA